MQNLKTLALALTVLVTLAGCSAIPGLNSSTDVNNRSGANTPAPTGSGQNTSETQNGDKAAGWPSDVPTQTAAYGFTYAKYIKSYTLSYQVKLNGKTLAQAHAEEIALLEAAGWTKNDDRSIEQDIYIAHDLTKDTRTITFGTTVTALSDDYATMSFYISDTTGGI